MSITKKVSLFGIPIFKTSYDDNIEAKGASLNWYPEKGRLVNLFDFENAEDVHKAILHVPELAAILNYLGKSFSSGEYKQFKGEQEIENSELIELLEQPNEFLSGNEFKQTVAEQLYAFGRCHIYVNTPSIPLNAQALHVLPAHLVKPYIGKIKTKEILEATDSVIKYYELDTEDGNVLKIPPEKIITFTLNIMMTFKDEYIHYASPLKPLQDALKVTPAMYDSMHNIMNNYGMIGFISNRSTDSGSYVPILDDQKESVHKAINKYGTRKGQRRYGFVNYDLRYTSVSSPIADMLLDEQQKLIKTIIADVLGFDTAILNNDDSNKYANYSEARKSLFSENIIPASKSYTESLSKYFFENDIILLDYSHLDIFTDDEKSKAEKIQTESDYIISLNEAVKMGMNRDSAVLVLTLNGYDQEDAEQLINPTTQNNEEIL